MNLDIFGNRGQRIRRFLWSSLGTLVFGAICIGTGVVAIAVASGGYENSRGQEVTPVAAFCPAIMCVFFGFFVIVCAMLAISSVRGAARLDGNTLIVRAAGKYSRFALNEAYAEIARGPVRKGLRLQNSPVGPPLLIVRASDGRPARLALSPE
ncbi:MAG: hypothetical protein HOQ05_06945, partial [Corynebacteriales bacterium]|nr:hypothetical protein [Mycobacteriales bacterium]